MPGCKRLVRKGEGKCPEHKGQYERDRYRTRGHHLYRTKAWQTLRASVIQADPYCRECGRLATAVDHIKPHHGREQVFFDEANLQPLCEDCHNAKSAAERWRGAAPKVRVQKPKGWRRLENGG